MWNGTTPILKAMPATTNTRPNARKRWSETLPASGARRAATSFRYSEPVAP
jgi:hypothetical protein